MYGPFIDKSGVQLVHEWMNQFSVQPGPDGLTLEYTKEIFGANVPLPERLHGFLRDLRLLRRVPLCYLVPDAALLPPESIRFFNLDLTWVDRVIDGVFSTANIGSIDFAYSCAMIALVRKRLDQDLVEIAQQQVPNTAWTPKKHPVTGLLIRSELTRRWPDMIIQPFATLNNSEPMPVLRSEPISRDIYIALIAGRPKMVHIREPHVGIRFGVEPVDKTKSAPPYEVDRRLAIGAPAPNSTPVRVKLRNGRVLNVAHLASQVGGSSRMVALHLEQRPYVQEFKDECPESRGSVPLPQSDIPLRRGRVINLKSLKTRLAQREELEKV
jgi:hypothetical protein